MNGGGQPRSESNSRAKDGGKAFLPIGIVFLVLAIAMMLSGSTSWIAFFTVGITFLILGTQKSSDKDERPPGKTLRD
ncbi:hypothetical protein [Arthrobacter antioxidans]|uniref:hypothetical protein n=1 Tax=Arthrobacter antioxidans TaxID=2895818 RepID=UPI001FFEEF53|nr:hypothetical protein [Arthrobacter antioxidans]